MPKRIDEYAAVTAPALASLLLLETLPTDPVNRAYNSITLTDLLTALGAGGSGTINSGTATQLAYYAATGTAVGSTPAFTIGASGNPAITSSGTADILLTTAGTYIDLKQAGGAGGALGLRIGQGRSASGYAFIDLFGDTTYTDYGLRIIRNDTGANAASDFVHRGTGPLRFYLQDSGGTLQYIFNGITRLQMSTAGALAMGAYTTAGLLANDASGNVTTATAGTSLSISSGVLNTIQDIRTTALPQFAGIKLTGLFTSDTGTGALPVLDATSLFRYGAPDGAVPRYESYGFGAPAMSFNGIAIGGTRAAQTATPADSVMIYFGGVGHDGSSMGSAKKISYQQRADGLWSGGNQGTYHYWQGTPSGSTTTAEWMRLQNGRLGIGMTPTNTLDVTGTFRVSGTSALAGVTLTSLGLRSTGAAFDLTLASSEVLTAGRTLSVVMGDAARTLTLSGNPTLADWFDQSVKTTATPTFGPTTVVGVTAGLGYVIGSELLDATGWTSTGWTGSFGAGFQHTSGNTSPLARTISGLTVGQVIKLAWTKSGPGSGIILSWTSNAITRTITFSSSGFAYLVALATTIDFSITTVSGNTSTFSAITAKVMAPTAASLTLRDSLGSDATFLYANKASTNNTLFGANAGGYLDSTGTSNTLLGYQAGLILGSNNRSVAIGHQALSATSRSDDNIAIGYQTLMTPSVGANIAIGSSALKANTSGWGNVAIGYTAGLILTTGVSNTLLGYQAGMSITTGSYNTIIGAGQQPIDATTSNWLNLHGVLFSDGSNVMIGSASLVTDATDGFLHIRGGGGTPTGVPTNYAGRYPLYYDSGADKLWIYNGSWRGVAVT
jgi:hypothetical protein